MNLLNFLAEDAPKGGNTLTYVLLAIVGVALIVFVIVMPMINSKKQNKKYQSLLDTVKIGDTVKTIGGIVGEVIALQTIGKQKEFVLLTGTGDNKTEMTFDINALYQIVDGGTHEPVPPVPVVEDPKNKKKGKKEEEASVVEEEVFQEDNSVEVETPVTEATVVEEQEKHEVAETAAVDAPDEAKKEEAATVTESVVAKPKTTKKTNKKA